MHSFLPFICKTAITYGSQFLLSLLVQLQSSYVYVSCIMQSIALSLYAYLCQRRGTYAESFTCTDVSGISCNKNCEQKCYKLCYCVVLVYFSVGMRNEKASRTRYVHILFDLDLPGALCFLNTFRKILVCPPLLA